MIALVGNKYDNYEYEEVQEIEAKHLSKHLNAIFHLTSAKTGSGVDELFEKIGRQYLNPDTTIINQTMKQEVSMYSNNIKLKNTKTENKKNKSCC